MVGVGEEEKGALTQLSSGSGWSEAQCTVLEHICRKNKRQSERRQVMPRAGEANSPTTCQMKVQNECPTGNGRKQTLPPPKTVENRKHLGSAASARPGKFSGPGRERMDSMIREILDGPHGRAEGENGAAGGPRPARALAREMSDRIVVGRSEILVEARF